MAEPDHDGDEGKGARDVLGYPTESLAAEFDGLPRRKRDAIRTIRHAEHGDQTPDNEDHHHYRGDLHDAEGLFARFVDADDVLAPEVQCDEDGEAGRKMFRMHVYVGQ